MSARLIKDLNTERQRHLAQAEYHDHEAAGYRRQMKEQFDKAVERRARAWECEQAIERLGGTVDD